MTEHDDLITRLRRLGSAPIEPPRQSSDLTAMAAVKPPHRIGPKLRVAAAFLAGLLIGSTGLAAAGALPDPAQHVAHRVLGQVGVDVPDPERYHGPECGEDVKRNHGAYVRDDHDLATTDCGKPTHAVDPGASGDEDPESEPSSGAPKGPKSATSSDDPCQGPPPWAGNQDASTQDKADAKAERATVCGQDADVDVADEPESE